MIHPREQDCDFPILLLCQRECLHMNRTACAYLTGVALLVLASGLPSFAFAGEVDEAFSSAASAQWPSIAVQRLPGDYAAPVHVTHAGDGSGRLFVVEKGGRIRIYRNGGILPTPFLDIADRVNARCGECGLLSVAFPPDYATGGYFFVYYTSNEDVADPEPYEEDNDTGNDTVVARFKVTGNLDLADPGSETRILVRNQPFTNHNGGQMAFGPDGYLYIGLGDGGGGGDPLDSGQRPDTWLGKILRIEVGATSTYAVPPDNPFVGSPTYLPEIWASGLRNPWRFSFDRATGDLFIGDVGQGKYEEIDFQPAASVGGENYGWNRMEGMHCDVSGCDTTGFVLPVAEYAHADNTGSDCSSVTGGAVYRGSFTSLEGIYFYADYCSGRIWGLQRNGGVWESSLLAETGLRIASFGEDEAGNLYVAELADANSIGHVYRIVDANAVYLPAVLQ